ncbi:DNA primase [Candidatus Gromoviella agglomerans]|uniref:DNA primase n=1 Tax=Candidatus Gromoviella agglomerans TaxID=2806609 RepID=UPI001E57E86E|nr:DNA primase [Candidatus Gromoviella agglomerans]UFX98356.1 DNA primase domain-containing protein [Candidatus Gromoviella agglomerans]
MDILSEIYSRTSLSNIISEYMNLTDKGSEKEGLCPFHKENTPSFMVNDAKGLFYCFGCGEGGNAISFIAKIQGTESKEATKILAKKFDIQLKSQSENFKENTINEIFSITNKWFQSRIFSPSGEEARSYLKNRNVSNEMIKEFEIGYCSTRLLNQYLISSGFSQNDIDNSDLFYNTEERREKFARRITFPITNEQGNVVGFAGRSMLNGAKSKYINSSDSPTFKKREILYGYLQASTKKHLPLVIVEGYFDVISLHQSKEIRAISPMGTAISHIQIQKAWKLHSNPIVIFDGDEAGKKASISCMLKAFEILTAGHSLNFVFLPIGFDPDSFIKSRGIEAFKDILSKSISLEEFMWNHVINEFPIKVKPEEKSLIYKRCMYIIDKIPDKKTKSYYIESINERMHSVQLKSFGRERRNSDYGGSFDRERRNSDYGGSFDRERRNSDYGGSFGRERRNSDYGGSFGRERRQTGGLSNYKRSLFAIYSPIIQNKDFLSRVREQFALIEIQDKLFDNIRSDALYSFDRNGFVDTQQLQEKYGDVISDICKNKDIGQDENVNLWKEIVNNYNEMTNRTSEIHRAKKSFTSNMNTESWNRMKALRKEGIRNRHQISDVRNSPS